VPLGIAPTAHGLPPRSSLALMLTIDVFLRRLGEEQPSSRRRLFQLTL
jgi:hypothetical protein